MYEHRWCETTTEYKIYGTCDIEVTSRPPPPHTHTLPLSLDPVALRGSGVWMVGSVTRLTSLLNKVKSTSETKNVLYNRELPIIMSFTYFSPKFCLNSGPVEGRIHKVYLFGNVISWEVPVWREGPYTSRGRVTFVVTTLSKGLDTAPVDEFIDGRKRT